jgi:hypothetical protein
VAALAAVPAGVVLAACGGAAPSSARSSPPESSRPAAQVLQDAAAAVARVRSYHMLADIPGQPGSVHVDLWVGGASAVSGTLTTSGTTAGLLIEGGGVYVRGRDFFRLTSGDAAANLIGDRWVLLPTSASRQLTGSLTRFTDTATLAHCLTNDPHGTLTATVSSRGGEPVVELRDAGDRPGTVKGALVVDANTALPVETRADGPASAGGPATDPACGSGAVDAGGGSGVVSFDHWGAPVSVTPPPSPLDLSASSSPPP